MNGADVGRLFLRREAHDVQADGSENRSRRLLAPVIAPGEDHSKSRPCDWGKRPRDPPAAESPHSSETLVQGIDTVRVSSDGRNHRVIPIKPTLKGQVGLIPHASCARLRHDRVSVFL